MLKLIFLVVFLSVLLSFRADALYTCPWGIGLSEWQLQKCGTCFIDATCGDTGICGDTCYSVKPLLDTGSPLCSLLQCSFCLADPSKPSCTAYEDGSTCRYGGTAVCASGGWACSYSSSCNMCDGARKRYCSSTGCTVASRCVQGSCGAACDSNADCGAGNSCDMTTCSCIIPITPVTYNLRAYYDGSNVGGGSVCVYRNGAQSACSSGPLVVATVYPGDSVYVKATPNTNYQLTSITGQVCLGSTCVSYNQASSQTTSWTVLAGTSGYFNGNFHYTVPSCYCGDHSCNCGETCSSCPGDCGVCNECGPDYFGTAYYGYDCNSYDECEAICLNGCINIEGRVGGEITDFGYGVDCYCSRDGLPCTGGTCWSEVCVPSVTCPNGVCGSGENCANCPQDCGNCCGDGSCNSAYGETCSTCPSDCGNCVTCPNGVCGSGENCANCPQDCGCQAGYNCVSGVCQAPTCTASCGACSRSSPTSCTGTQTCTRTDCTSYPNPCNMPSGTTCGTTTCSGDYCQGTTFYDYPSTCTRLCNSAGSCQSCSCTANPFTCDSRCFSCGDGTCNSACGESCGTCSSDCGTCITPTVTISATPASVPADGTSSSIIRATLSSGASGVTVPLTTTRGTLTPSSCVTSGGTCTVTLRSTSIGLATVRSTLSGYNSNSFDITFTSTTTCPNGVCSGETCATCPQDCGNCCGDGSCNYGETCSTCPSDCGNCVTCPNGVCDASETCSSCPQDCGNCVTCPNGVCGSGENCANCPQDCGCPSGYYCDSGICRLSCTPATCFSLGKNCGSWYDGCSLTLNCGSCGFGYTCNNGMCAYCNACASPSDCGSTTYGTCTGFTSTCDESGTMQVITPFCNDIDSDNCNECGNTTSYPGCTRVTDGTYCDYCEVCDTNGGCSVLMTDDENCGTVDCSGWYLQTGTESVLGTEYCYNKHDFDDTTGNRCEAADDNSCKDSNTADCISQPNDAVVYSCGICKYISSSSCTGATLGGCSNYNGFSDGLCDFDDTCNDTLGRCEGDTLWFYHDCTYYCDNGNCANCYCGVNQLESGFDDVCDCQLERPDCSQPGNWDGDTIACNCDCNDYDIIEDVNINPDACNDGKDNDCNGLIDSQELNCPENTFNFTGTLYYSKGLDNQAVRNSLIRVTVTNTVRNFEKSAESTTDENGYFFVKVVNLPYFMLEEDFDLSIYVESEVDALYECHYYSSGPNQGKCL